MEEEDPTLLRAHAEGCRALARKASSLNELVSLRNLAMDYETRAAAIEASQGGDHRQ